MGKRATLVAGIASAALVLGACSDDTAATESAEAQIEANIQAFEDAFNEGNAEKFATLVCAEYADDYDADTIAAQIELSLAAAGKFTLDITNITIDGDKATGDVSTTVERNVEAQPAQATHFVREDGSWKLCEPNEMTTSEDGTTAPNIALSAGSSLSVDGNPVDGAYFAICQRGSAFTIVALTDFADESNNAFVSLVDDSVTSVAIGRTADDEPVWEAVPLTGQGSATLTKDGELTFLVTGEVVNKASQELSPFALTIVCSEMTEG